MYSWSPVNSPNSVESAVDVWLELHGIVCTLCLVGIHNGPNLKLLYSTLQLIKRTVLKVIYAIQIIYSSCTAIINSYWTIRILIMLNHKLSNKSTSISFVQILFGPYSLWSQFRLPDSKLGSAGFSELLKYQWPYLTVIIYCIICNYIMEIAWWILEIITISYDGPYQTWQQLWSPGSSLIDLKRIVMQGLLDL